MLFELFKSRVIGVNCNKGNTFFPWTASSEKISYESLDIDKSPLQSYKFFEISRDIVWIKLDLFRCDDGSKEFTIGDIYVNPNFQCPVWLHIMHFGLKKRIE